MMGDSVRERSLKVIHLDAFPVLFVAGDELFVEVVDLVDVVGGGVVEDDGEADGVGVVDDVAWGHGGDAGPDMADGRDFPEELDAVLAELLDRGGGRSLVDPEIDG